MRCTVLRVDAFTTIKGLGNPAGVVLKGDRYTDFEMQRIAKKVGYNETVFVCKSDFADIRLRYFTPGHETPLCGHATIGAVFALYEGQGNRTIFIETGVGILPIHYDDKNKRIKMKQAIPKFIPFLGDRLTLCGILGIKETDIHSDLPIEYGNTGSWTLILPVKDKLVLDDMEPKTKEFPGILKEIPKSSIHPFSIDSKNQGLLSARHFSSPYSGTIEDSVTGTASGVMGAYLMNHVYTNTKKEFVVSQGKQVNSEGNVFVEIIRGKDNKHNVSISGTACFNELFSLTITSE